MVGKQAGLAAITAILLMPIQAMPAGAEMQILESNVPQFRVGDRIADTSDLPLPTEGRVKVLVLPANETKVFQGAARHGMKDIPLGGIRGSGIKQQN